MKLKLFLAISAAFFTCALFGQNPEKPLTEKEKVEDFKYLVKELKATYPYFDVNKRKHGIDWLNNKKKYCKKIEATQNDTEFYVALRDILDELHNGHTDMLPTFYYEYFIQGYEQALGEAPKYKPYVEELKKYGAAEKYKHWIKIKADLAAAEDSGQAGTNDATEAIDEQANVEIEWDDKNDIAILKVRSFSYDFIEEDAPIISDFMKKVDSYKNLIIDIQGNHGGDDSYWRSNIVAHLIGANINYEVITAFKPSARITRMKPDYQANLDYKKIDLPNMPEELKKGKYLFMHWEEPIEPNENTINYQGNIYLLVDDIVYSSAETFAYFCRSTQFATIAGIQTNGDGVGSDPLLLTLPNSGIVIRFTGEMALNPDGSSNEEMRTVPDLILNGENEQERLKLLKESIIK